jgi:hypothetical protein
MTTMGKRRARSSMIVIMGENRTFDHLFATYQPRPGEHVDNLLSKKIINIDGSPGPNYGLAVQNHASVTGTFSISPGGKTPYGTGGNALNVPSTSYAPKVPYTNLYDPVTGAAVNGPGAVATLALAHEATSDLSSGYSEGGHVSHEYSDHASIIKFIERNWQLPKLSDRSRDNLKNPITANANPYVPINSPAIGDLFGNFDFDGHDGQNGGDH